MKQIILLNLSAFNFLQDSLLNFCDNVKHDKVAHFGHLLDAEVHCVDGSTLSRSCQAIVSCCINSVEEQQEGSLSMAHKQDSAICSLRSILRNRKLPGAVLLLEALANKFHQGFNRRATFLGLDLEQ